MSAKEIISEQMTEMRQEISNLSEQVGAVKELTASLRTITEHHITASTVIEMDEIQQMQVLCLRIFDALR